MAPSDSDEPPDDDDEPVVKYDDATMTMVPEIRSLCSLPADPTNEPLQTFRAMLFDKGATLHVPEELGSYVTLKPWSMQSALDMVHFIKSTKRVPEILIGFADYAAMMGGKPGSCVYVVSLMLPLLKAHNIYQNTPRYTKAIDVAGFSPIDLKVPPWCTNLKPTLERCAPN